MTDIPPITRRALATGFAALAASSAAPAKAQSAPIKIGDLNSYARWAAFAVPYRNGWQLAVEQINAGGGVLGRQLVVASRDDGGTPTDALRAAEDLVTRENCTVLMGTFLSNISLAVADFAKQRKTVFVPVLSATDALSLAGGNRYTFHFRANVYMYANMLVQEAAKTNAKRWAIVAPNYEYGQSAASAFKRLTVERMPGSTVVAEQYPPLGKVDVGSIANVLEEAEPDGIMCALFGADLAQFVRGGQPRGLFENRAVFSIASGYPEYLMPMGDTPPVGWTTEGYPWEGITIPAHMAFVASYRAKYGEGPGAFAMQGFAAMNMVKDAIQKAGGAQPEALVDAMKGMSFDSIVGRLAIRAIDNKVTMGSWVGKIALRGNIGALVDWSYKDGADYLISEADVKASRRE